jgi:aminopeptidase N
LRLKYDGPLINVGFKFIWRIYALASGLDVGGLMSCWTSQTGYPLLSVATVRRCRLTL